ncbi:MAG: DUF2993 domain-containing protein [Chitinophagaceae bacterium]|jgi:hypothetical protein|nr:DUF2993 domain-containing protein [Chitinophagaceae bacterium]
MTPLPAPATDPPPAASGPLLQLLASALKLWVRQQCETVGSLEIQLLGSSVQLLRGRLAGVKVLARQVTYRGLDLERVELTSSALELQLSPLWRGQPLQFRQPFQISGRVAFSPAGLCRSLARPAWRALADPLADQLLGITPLVGLRIEADRLVFAARPIVAGPLVERPATLQAVPGGLRITPDDGNAALLPIDPAIALDQVLLEAGQVVLTGQAAVSP